MITEFFFDDAFLSSPYFNDEALRVLHDAFLKNWHEYGVLVIPHGYMPRYLAAIQKLPVKYRSLWSVAFAHGRTSCISHSWTDINGLVSFDEAVRNLSGFFRTAFAEETLAYVVCNNDAHSRYCSKTKFEMIAAPEITASENFKKSEIVSKKDIADSEDINVVWVERFQMLAKHTKRIVICDRYLFERILKDIERGVIPNMKTFLDFLMRETGKFYITIFSDGGELNSQRYVEVRNYFDGLLRSAAKYASKVELLTLISNDKNLFQQFSHDRYIRFDDYVCALGSGMAIFERNPIVNTTISIKLKPLTNVEAIEKALREKPYWVDKLI